MVLVEKSLQQYRQHLAAGKTRARRGSYARGAAGGLMIQVVFHVLHDGRSVAAGGSRLPQAMLDRQIDVLNAAYGGSGGAGARTGLQFTLRSINYVQSAAWTADCRGTATAYRKKHSWQDPTVVNVFTCPIKGFLGWAYMPWQYSEGSPFQSVTVHPGTFPGGTFAGLNEGDTLVHEMGHYLGLLHTFSTKGSCHPAHDDKVADTPLEKFPSYSCARRDSCPDSPGLDPVTNFMDYSPDGCMDRFSDGQAVRIVEMMDQYRPKLLGASYYYHGSGGVAVAPCHRKSKGSFCNARGYPAVSADGLSCTCQRCIDGYTGPRCEASPCAGKTAASLCNGRGTPYQSSRGACLCQSCSGGHSGDYCERSPCWGKTGSNHCSGRGTPAVTGSVCACAACQSGYTGGRCEVSACDGKSRDSFCGGRGAPVIAGGVCKCSSCSNGYTGTQCEQSPCFDQSSAQLCGGRGDPVISGSVCKCTRCRDGFTGDLCQRSPCFGRTSSNLCKGRGSPALGPFGTCVCTICTGGYTGAFCERSPCFGRSAADLCGGRGQPTIVGTTCQCAECDAGWSGEYCERSPCFGRDAAVLCKGRGSKVVAGALCKCKSCKLDYAGDFCEMIPLGGRCGRDGHDFTCTADTAVDMASARVPRNELSCKSGACCGSVASRDPMCLSCDSDGYCNQCDDGHHLAGWTDPTCEIDLTTPTSTASSTASQTPTTTQTETPTSTASVTPTTTPSSTATSTMTSTTTTVSKTTTSTGTHTSTATSQTRTTVTTTTTASSTTTTKRPEAVKIRAVSSKVHEGGKFDVAVSYSTGQAHAVLFVALMRGDEWFGGMQTILGPAAHGTALVSGSLVQGALPSFDDGYKIVAYTTFGHSSFSGDADYAGPPPSLARDTAYSVQVQPRYRREEYPALYNHVPHGAMTEAFGTTPLQPNCTDAPGGWRDSRGESCDAYTTKQYCRGDGGVGPGWPDAGSFADAVEPGAAHAGQVCCACGGGEYPIIGMSSATQASTAPTAAKSACFNARVQFGLYIHARVGLSQVLVRSKLGSVAECQEACLTYETCEAVQYHAGSGNCDVLSREAGAAWALVANPQIRFYARDYSCHSFACPAGAVAGFEATGWLRTCASYVALGMCSPGSPQTDTVAALCPGLCETPQAQVVGAAPQLEASDEEACALQCTALGFMCRSFLYLRDASHCVLLPPEVLVAGLQVLGLDHDTKTCAELGWPFRAKGSSVGVCAETPSSYDCDVSADHTHSSAATVCATLGARLCTVDELYLNVARGTGCGLDKNWVWTGDACEDGGFMVAFGSSAFKNKNPSTCRLATEQGPGARCCADKAPAGPPAASAAQLFTRRPACAGSSSTVTESTTTTSSTSATRTTATTTTKWRKCPLCARQYSPVCGSNHESYYNPCYAKCDGVRTWLPGVCRPPAGECAFCSGEYAPVCSQGTSHFNECTAYCRGAFHVTKGLCSHAEIEAALVRQLTSAKSCEELRETVRAPEAFPLVCAVGKPNGMCYSDKWTYAEAVDVCRQGGSRLCTFEELDADVTLRTGCKNDVQYLWTQTECEGGHKITPGYSARARDRLPTQCVIDTTRSAAIRCCADVYSTTTTATDTSSTATSMTQTSSTATRSTTTATTASATTRSSVTQTTTTTQSTVTDSTTTHTSATATTATTATATTATATTIPLPTTVTTTTPWFPVCEQVDESERGFSAELPGVCGLSKLHGECHLGHIDQPEAEALCRSAGAQLCSVDELLAGVVKDTGCGLNAEYVWTRTTCDAGEHFVGPGSPDFMFQTPFRCVPDDASLSPDYLGVACCDAAQARQQSTVNSAAPVQTTTAAPAKTLAPDTSTAAPAETAATDTSTATTATTLSGTTPTTTTTRTTTTTTARTTTTVTTVTSTSTSTTIRTDPATAAAPPAPPTSRPGAGASPGREPVRSANTCEEVGLAPAAALPTVCAVSRINGKCYPNNLNYLAAKNLCASTGARLCSRQELDHGIVYNTKCRAGARVPTWVSDECDAGHYTTAGVPKHHGRVPTVCQSDTAVAGVVRCCHDVAQRGATGEESAEDTCDRMCMPTQQPVCASGKNFPNPCRAFCAGFSEWSEGVCKSCRYSSALDGFLPPVAARIPKSTKRSLGVRQLDVPDAEACAQKCIDYGAVCAAFEYRAPKRWCELKSASGRGNNPVGISASKVWHLYDRAKALCIPSFVSDPTNV